MVAGGTAQFPDDAEGIHQHRHFDGHRHCAIYNPPTGAFVTAADMGTEPGLTTGGGRWYPTLCTLATGEVLVFQGHPGGDDNRHGNNTPERYQPLANHWVMLPAIGDVANDPILYPRLHLLRDGTVFVSSRIPGFGAVTFGQNITVDPWSGATRQLCGLPDGAVSRLRLPVRPAAPRASRWLPASRAAVRRPDLPVPGPGAGAGAGLDERTAQRHHRRPSPHPLRSHIAPHGGCPAHRRRRFGQRSEWGLQARNLSHAPQSR